MGGGSDGGNPAETLRARAWRVLGLAVPWGRTTAIFQGYGNPLDDKGATGLGIIQDAPATSASMPTSQTARSGRQ